MYTKGDLISVCHEAIDNAYAGADAFLKDRSAHSVRKCMEAIEACEMVLSCQNNFSSLNSVLNICADLCEMCAEECENYQSVTALKTAVSCRKCVKIARALHVEIRTVA